MQELVARALGALVVLFVFACARPAAARPPAPAADRTLAPYFFVEGGDEDVDRLPLESARVEVAVSGPIAAVTLTQVYRNSGTKTLNTRYVFPASTHAAVHGLQMKIRDQRIEARIEERARAEKTFENAKKAGKSASLLEQQRPNVFGMRLANVMPGDRIEVALRYTELLVPTSGTYELVIPTVVGPRYSSATASEQWLASPYLRAGAVPARFELEGAVSSAIPIQRISSETHPIQATWDNARFVRFTLPHEAASSGNRDFILKYRLAGEAIQSGLSLYEGDGEQFFLLLVEPPARVAAEAMPAREYVFVVDVSGSMSGFPLDTAKALLRKLAAGLRPIDTFNVLTFSGGSDLLAPESLPATPANVAAALDVIDRQQGGGSTELVPALERALALSRKPGLARSFLIVTDGYVSADREAMTLVRSRLGEANVFAFGIGSSVNRFLIEGLARAGMGEPFVVTDPALAPAVAERLHAYVRAPVLTDVRVDYDGFDVYDVEPRAIPDVLAERPVVLHGKWRGAPKGRVRVSGVSGRGAYAQSFDVAIEPPRAENRALRQLWARTRISTLADFAFAEAPDATRTEVTALGLRYNLLTQYTSFVAVTKTVRNTGAPGTDVNQPLPLPLGVSELAVGDSITSASEPELVALLVALLAVLAAARLLRPRPAPEPAS